MQSGGRSDNRGKASIEDLVTAAGIAVLLLGFAVFWLTTDLTNVSESSDKLGRFIWAGVHIAVPTTRFAVYLEIILAIIGGVTIARENIKAYIFGMVFLYLLVNFVTAWFAAPV